MIDALYEILGDFAQSLEEGEYEQISYDKAVLRLMQLFNEEAKKCDPT